MNDASRNTVKGNSLNTDSFEVTQSILLLGVAARFEKSSRGRSTVTVENRCPKAWLLKQWVATLKLVQEPSHVGREDATCISETLLRSWPVLVWPQIKRGHYTITPTCTIYFNSPGPRIPWLAAHDPITSFNALLFRPNVAPPFRHFIPRMCQSLHSNSCPDSLEQTPASIATNIWPVLRTHQKHRPTSTFGYL